MKARGNGFTDTGKRRSTNEDALYVDNDLGLFVVSDGMGGHPAGDVASREAVSAVASYVQARVQKLDDIRTGRASESELIAIAGNAVARACRRVYAYAGMHPETAGMGCTLTVLLVGRDKAAMAHVGDSRLYRERHGALRQLTVDHTIGEELARRGLISREQMPLLPYGHALARAVGVHRTVEWDEMLLDLCPGDRFILCSDGVWGYFPEPEDMVELLDMREPDQIARTLVMFANAAGGKDNATAVAVDIHSSAEVESCIPVELETAATAKTLAPSSEAWA